MAKNDTDTPEAPAPDAGLREAQVEAEAAIAALTERVDVLEAHNEALDQALAQHREALGARIDELARLVTEPEGGTVDQRARQILGPLVELLHDQAREMPARRIQIAKRIFAAAGPLLPERLRG